MASRLESLPDELILEIFGYVRPIRTHFEHYGKRRREQFKALNCLASLRLTSKPLSTIATPLLFSDAILSERHDDSTNRLSALLEIVIHKPELGGHIHYLKHNLEAFSSAERDDEDSQWQKQRTEFQLAAAEFWAGEDLENWNKDLMVIPVQAQLTLLLLLAPNITSMHIELFTHATTHFQSLLGFGDGLKSSSPSRIHAFARLERMYICCGPAYVNEDMPQGQQAAQWYHHFFSFVQRMGALRNLVLEEPPDPSQHLVDLPATIDLQKLESLHLLHCDLSVSALSTILSLCGHLTGFTYWPSVARHTLDFAVLFSGLSKNKNTLEELQISVGSIFNGVLAKNPIGSFADFERLKLLRLPEVALMGAPHDYEQGDDYEWTIYKPVFRMSQHLPISLEILLLSAEFTIISDNTAFLWDFVEDLSRFPNLRTCQLANYVRDGSNLDAAIEKHGLNSEPSLSFDLQKMVPGPY